MEQPGALHIVGVDLAKRTFSVHGADSSGYALFRLKLTRSQFAKFLSELPNCILAMEACASAHHWGREAERLGLDVRLIPPVYVKPFARRQKNDAVDARAIVEAAMRPTMSVVAVKTTEQQAQAVVFRSRDLLVRQRTQLINALRGHLAECRASTILAGVLPHRGMFPNGSRLPHPECSRASGHGIRHGGGGGA